MSDSDLNPDSKFSWSIGIPAASTRAATGTINPAPNGVVIIMGDGGARDQTRPSGRKFQGTITTNDIWPLPLSGVWVGTVIQQINYPGELIEPIGAPQERPEVPGSMFYANRHMEEVEQNDPTAVWRVYCPILTIIVLSWKQEDDDWGAKVKCSFDWREV